MPKFYELLKLYQKGGVCSELTKQTSGKKVLKVSYYRGVNLNSDF
jgi:hypothetical protein